MRYQQYITNALIASVLLVIDLFSRYLIALVVGIAFWLYSAVIGLDIAMSHFGMRGKLMNADLFLFMIYEVPAWAILSKIIGHYWKSAVVEVVSAILVATVLRMAMGLVVHLSPELVEGSITDGAKMDLLLSHILAMTNLILGIACALSYLAAKRLLDGKPRPGWLGYKPWK